MGNEGYFIQRSSKIFIYDAFNGINTSLFAIYARSGKGKKKKQQKKKN